jgi:uncharacterized protein (TIGR02284 family)
MDGKTVKQVVNDLLKINNDRIEGYQKATKQLQESNGDADLVALFNECIALSTENKAALTKASGQYDTDAADDTTVPGEIYRVWMDMKAAFSGDTRQTVLESCEFGEDAAQKAYKEAIKNYEDLPAHIMQLIQSQKTALRQHHDKIKSLRDSEKIAH